MKSFEFGSQKVALFSDGEPHDFTDNEIAVGDVECYTETLYIKAFDGVNTYVALLTGIEDAYYLHQATPIDKSQSVKLCQQGLILSLGRTLVCLSWPELKLNWKLKPDMSCIFEFYDLEDDILLRGELEIFRISLRGEVVWSYGGMDIWVNIEGKPEVTILENSIKLIDFEANEYLIDFDGKTLQFTERLPLKPLAKPWWKFWK